MKRIICLAVAAALCITAASVLFSKPKNDKPDMPLRKFWNKTFIPALEKKNIDKVVTMTAFPFSVIEGGEKKHIIDEPFYRSIVIKVLFNKAFVEKLKKLDVYSLPFDGTYYRIRFTAEEAPQNMNEIFILTPGTCFNYIFGVGPDGKSLVFYCIEINLPCS